MLPHSAVQIQYTQSKCVQRHRQWKIRKYVLPNKETCDELLIIPSYSQNINRNATVLNVTEYKQIQTQKQRQVICGNIWLLI